MGRRDRITLFYLDGQKTKAFRADRPPFIKVQRGDQANRFAQPTEHAFRRIGADEYQEMTPAEIRSQEAKERHGVA